MSDYTHAKVLLVEDNPSDLELALHLFEHHGFHDGVAVARDGNAALDFVFATGAQHAGRPRPHLKVVVLDLKLPKIGGLDVLARIKADPTTRMIPVVVLTSSLEETDVAEAYRLGANSFIVKPVDYEQLSRCIREIGSYWLGLNECPKHVRE